jgi:hypothetical protein
MSAIRNARLRKVLNGFSVPAGLLLLTVGACDRRTNGSFNPNASGNLSDGVTQCCSAAPPTGAVKVNDDWDPSKCGNPSTTDVRNICTYQRYDDKPVGTTLTVCASAIPPAGWVNGPKSWDPTKCGHPSSVTDNMKLITRKS